MHMPKLLSTETWKTMLGGGEEEDLDICPFCFKAYHAHVEAEQAEVEVHEEQKLTHHQE